MTMRTALAAATLSLAILGCSSGKAEQGNPPQTTSASSQSAPGIDACKLLTYEEIKGAAGWTPDSTKTRPYGATSNCLWYGPNALTQNVSVLIGQGMPDMPSSKQLADWRAKQYADYKVTNATVEPIEGLGVPAIRNEFGVEGVEMVVGKQLVTVSGLTLKADQVKKLAVLVLAHMK